MEEVPTLRLLYLTLPTASEPTLNIQIGEHFARFKVTRDQLYDLNSDIADALIRGRQRRLPNGQLDLNLIGDPNSTEH